MWCRVSRVFATVVFGRCVAAKVVVLLLSKTVIFNFNPLIITPRTSRANSALCLPRSMGVAGSSSSRT